MWSRSRVLPQREVLRARIVLLAAQGVANEMIAQRLGCSKPNVLKWRARFEAGGIEGLEEAVGRGRPATYSQDFAEKVIATTLAAPPQGSTHWSVRTLAKELGVSHSTVHRIWRQRRLQPHPTTAFKFSNDPQLADKVRDVVGLYLNPPEKALVGDGAKYVAERLGDREDTITRTYAHVTSKSRRRAVETISTLLDGPVLGEDAIPTLSRKPKKRAK